MNDFVMQPLTKKLNRENILSRIERIERSAGERPSASVVGLGEIGMKTDILLVDQLIVPNQDTGDYDVTMDTDGITLEVGTYASTDGPNAIKWEKSGAEWARIVTHDPGAVTMEMRTSPVADTQSNIIINALGNSSSLQLIAQATTTDLVSTTDLAQIDITNGDIEFTGNLIFNGGATLATINTGTYTPALTNVTNVAASTAYICQYLRIGNVVTVSGRVDIDPTATGATELGMSLPIASNFAGGTQCSGTFSSHLIAGLGGSISADITNDRAQFRMNANDTANREHHFIFTYIII